MSKVLLHIFLLLILTEMAWNASSSSTFKQYSGGVFKMFKC